MGCVGSTEEDLKSREIQRDLDKSKSNNNKISKLLLLGAGESGKSTFFRQLRICHGEAFTKDDLLLFKPIVFSNTLQCMRTVIENSSKIEGCTYSKNLEPQVQMILDPNMRLGDQFPSTLADAIQLVWRDPGIKLCWQNRSEYQVFDSASFFFDIVQELANPDYCPTVDHMLKSRVRTSGIVEAKFDIDGAKFHVFDVGGQRSERKKWIHCFEGVTAVLFVAAVSEFNQVLVEDGHTNRMEESMNVFSDIIGSRWFKKSDVILFLNKSDLLKQKLEEGAEIGEHFPEYVGNNSYDDVSEFIKEMYEGKAVGRDIYAHFTCATGEVTALKQLFQSVKTIIVEKSVRSGGLLL